MATSFKPAFAEAESAALPNWIETIRATQSGFSGGMPFGAASPIEPSADSASHDVDAIAQARAEGEAVGRTAAQTEFDAKLAEVESTVLQIEQAFADQMAALLNETVIALCEKTLAPLAMDKDILLQRCQNAAAAIESDLSHAQLALHPDDCAAVEPVLGDTLSLMPDPQLARGNIRLTTPSTAIFDGPDQWSASIRRAIEAC